MMMTITMRFNKFYTCFIPFLYISLFLIYFFQSVHAQTKYANDWIDYQQTYHKIKVGKEGLYRINTVVLTEAGFTTPIGEYFKLYYYGQEVPLYASTSGLMGDQDYLEFYGRPNNGSFDTKLYKQATWQPHQYKSLFSDTSAYYLTFVNSTDNKRYINAQNDINDPPAPTPWFMHNLLTIVDEVHSPGESVKISGVLNNLADFMMGECFASEHLTDNAKRDFNLKVSGLYTNADAPNASLETIFIGRSNALLQNDHKISVQINGATAADTVFDGYNILYLNLTTKASTLTTPTTTVTINNKKVYDEYISTTQIASINLSYPHTFGLENSSYLRFKLSANQDHYLEITEFKGGTSPVLYDLTNVQRFTPVDDNGVYKIKLPAIPNATDTTTRTLWLSTTSGFSQPNSGNYRVLEMEKKQFTNFGLLENQGNYLLISHPYLQTGGVDEVSRYANYRRSAQGGGYKVAQININELYDQFAYGIEKHPVAIKDFVNFAIDKWTTKPKYLLLLGKSISYEATRAPSIYHKCLVPTFGEKASDIMLATKGYSNYYTQLAVGRIPAQNPSEVKAYLNKIITYEANKTNLPCTKTDRRWMKDALHIAGGYNLDESKEFMGYLSGYKQAFEQPKYGGKVVFTYNKVTDEVITKIDDLDAIINNGLAVLNFFGHSSGQTFNVALKHPKAYKNYNKYPFIFTSSCFVGDIHYYAFDDKGNYLPSLPEEFILCDSLGAIGFLASATIGLPTRLDYYIDHVYYGFCDSLYNQPVGLAAQMAVKNTWTKYANNENSFKITAQQYTLTGDPALVINSFELPDLAIETPDVFFNPPLINPQATSFEVNIVLHNLGKAVTDSISFTLNHTLPQGQINTYTYKLPTPPYADTVKITIPIPNPEDIAGENIFTATIDANNQLTEPCENNNSITKRLFIYNDVLIPIAPCNFSIVNTKNPDTELTLYASTGQPLAENKSYLFQIDTTQVFNQPLAQATQQSSGGVLQFKPQIPLINNTVYYWRTAPQTTGGNEPKWRYSSFVYLPNEPEGFNQSHAWQIASCTFKNEQLNYNLNTRTLQFTPGNNYGTISTLPLGPSLGWGSVNWNFVGNETELDDQFSLKIYGIAADESEKLLLTLSAPLAGSADISTINAATYRFIRMEAEFKDTINKTPLQLNYWRVLFQRPSEIALDAQRLFSFYKDTLGAGDLLKLQVGIFNPSQTASDSIVAQITLLNPKNEATLLPLPPLPPLPPQTADTLVFTYPTQNMAGNYLLEVELNHNNAQPEKHAFNNVLTLPFYVLNDKVNPVIDVTFDGRRVIDGEIISAKPDIRIQLHDDSRFLALNDTADIQLTLLLPDTTKQGKPLLEQRIYFNHPDILFVAATSDLAQKGKNTAYIKFTPNFTADGQYGLLITAKDRSGNAFANQTWRTTFKVITKTSISNWYTYPNPFTTQTRFVFTITGSEVPNDIKVQILTISGKVVREITRAELGPLHIGNNITDFAWDGTDQHGDPLGNGVYLYKVVVQQNNQALDHYATPADKLQLFTSNQNYGKIYLLR